MPKKEKSKDRARSAKDTGAAKEAKAAKTPRREKSSPKDRPRTAAVIDIGSNELRLKIAENARGKFKYIENLTYPLSLGRDTFDTGKISFEKVEKTCAIIKNFLAATEEYGVGTEDVRVIATTAVREAVNSEYILDQIKIKTGLDIRVIDDMDEKLYIYKLVSSMIDEELKQSAMMVYIGSGNIGMSVLENGRIPFLQNVKIGSLRISEMFEDIQEYSGEFYVVLEEYLNSFTDILEGELPRHIKNFIVSGNEIAMVAELAQAEKNGVFYAITKEKFTALYGDLKNKTTDRISAEYRLPMEKAEVLLPAMCIYSNLLRFTQTDVIISPQILLSDAIVYEMLFPDEFAAINKEFNKNTVLSARALAKKYGVIEGHSRKVEDFALTIFDKMKKIHGMGAREKLLLQVAAVLHDIGKFVNLRNHYQHSYYIARGSDIVGLNQRESEIVALICGYHSRLTPTLEDENYRKLGSFDRVLVSKLSAILRISDSLDRSHTQKLDGLDAKLTETELILTMTTDKNTDLENWAFNERAVFFEEVFGIKASIRKKKVM
ncbi:MAG: HD domain-containing protein [Firmicutes bacterium]|nr:HD domain-containing protein [Bacillota bacterium]